MSTPARKPASDELLAASACLRQALDQHVDELAAVVSQLRQAAHLDPPEPPDCCGDPDA